MESYKVKWKQIWISLSKYALLAVFVGVGTILIVRFLKYDFDYKKAFEHISSIESFLIFISIFPIACIFMLPISLLMTLYSVTINESTISGRNYWLPKREIPLDDIISLDTENQSGITGYTVKSKYYGSLFFPEQIENLERLTKKISSQLPDENSN